MFFRRWLPAATAISIGLLAAAGCGGGNEVGPGRDRSRNRPPIVLKDSLTWLPADGAVVIDLPYVFSVVAIDPDFFDVVDRYEWVFGNIDEDASDPPEKFETVEPNVAITLNRDLVENDHGVYAVSLKVRARDNWGLWGEYESFYIPVTVESKPYFGSGRVL
jgi:hypothetical protein